MDNLGIRLRKLRNSKKLTQNDIIKYLNNQGIKISQSMYSSLERGERTVKRAVIEALADFYNVSIDYLHGRENKSVKLVDPLAPNLEDDNEVYLLNTYRDLNDKGQEIARIQLESLARNPELIIEKFKEFEVDENLKAAHYDYEGKSQDQVDEDFAHDDDYIKNYIKEHSDT